MDSHFNSSFEEIICSFLEKTILQKNKPLKPYHGSMDISIHIGYHRLIHYMKDVYAIYSDKHRATNIYNDKIPLEYIEKHIEDIDWDWGLSGLLSNPFTQEYYKIQSKIKRAYYKNEVINVLYHNIKGISIEHLSNIIITFSV